MIGDLSTAAGVLRFCELRRAEMVRCFERLGRFECNGFSFGAYAFATHALRKGATGAKLSRVAADLCQLPRDINDLDDCAQCIEATGSPCSWAEPDLCSRCVGAD